MEQEKITIQIPSEILPLVAKKRKDIPSKVLEYLILRAGTHWANSLVGRQRNTSIWTASSLSSLHRDKEFPL